jgi:hypothetical protein
MTSVRRCPLRTHHEVPDPVRRCAEAVGRGADAKRHDLGRVQPSHAEPANGEEGVEDEEENNAGNLVSGLVSRVHSREDRHSGSLASGAEEHELPAANALNEPDGRNRREEVLCSIEGGEQTGEEGRHAELVDMLARVTNLESTGRHTFE